MFIFRVARLHEIAILFTLSTLLKYANGSVKCPGSAPTTSSNESEAIFDFGDPVMFVTTGSQKYDAYSLVDPYRRTSILEEYMMVGYHKEEGVPGVVERVQMIFYDAVKRVLAKATDAPDLVHQNLEKELYWRYFNSTGIYPSMTIVNTTKRISVQFHTQHQSQNGTNDISFVASITEREYFKAPQVPYNLIFEIPANSRVLRKDKTMIQYQSFSLWRWKLSNVVMDWSNITATSDPYRDNPLISYFHRIDNPCIKDMFLLCLPRDSKSAGPGDKLVYLGSPLIQSHLDENWFYDMNTKDHPWWPDVPETIILTNDHLVILTNNSLWVSNSLNDSSNPEIDLEMVQNYTDRPSLTYSRVDPCEKFDTTLDCFLPANNTNGTYTFHRLFYTPVCYLYQFPNYDDYIIQTIERQSNTSGEVDKDFTVLYASTPYKEWHVLFSHVAVYKMFQEEISVAGNNVQYTRHLPIEKIVGIVFNHHLRQFDITVELNTHFPKFVRFVLPEPATSFHEYGEYLTEEQLHKAHAVNSTGLKQLNGTMGNGFVEFAFPKNFEVDSVVMNIDTMDLFFLGNQFWIAEAGGSVVYAAMTGLSPQEDSICNRSINFNKSRIRECTFNHPDNAYLCMNEDRRLILSGKVGSRYTPSVIRIDYIQEFLKVQKVNPWPSAYFCELVQKRSVFVAAFSGRILFWYLHEPNDEAKALDAEISSGCAQPSQEPILCDDLADWQSKGCTAEPSGKTGFRLLVIDPSKFMARHQSTDGPLAPFLLDANTMIIYEGIVPEIDNGTNYDYFNEVYVGQKIFCTNYDLEKTDADDEYLQRNCELFVRHIRPVDNYLDCFRRIVYVTVVKSVPLLPVPADLVVLILARSNMALIKINDYINTPPWVFTKDHIGQTVYVPGNFSILLTGFPIENDDTVMEGYTTRHFTYQRRFIFRAFYTFLVDMSTQIHRQARESLAATTINNTKLRWQMFDEERNQTRETQIRIRDRIQKRWEDSPFAHVDSTGNKTSVFRGTVPPFIGREQEEMDLLTIKPLEQNNITNQPHAWTPISPKNPNDLVYGQVAYTDRLVWYVAESECHYILSLVNNPVLKTSGGRISLDLYDRISFEVILRPLTSLGKILMYRPLLSISNSNPGILRAEVIEKIRGNPQYLQILLSPTGFRKGVAVITVRTRVSPLRCTQSSSLTLIVLCHRDVGRRLHINYPVPSCKPIDEMGMYPRPWYNEMEGCISSDEILDPEKSEIIRFRADKRLVAYVSLPTNYRPPSLHGADIPQTKNVYNADPSKPAYKAWYKISRETIQLKRCKGKSEKSECDCSDVDRLMEDEELSECKEKVFYTKRTGMGEPITMSITYDRVMKDKDQNPELFLPKTNWSITIEEVNGRGEWYISSDHTPYLRMINTNPDLHRGRRYYDMRKFKVSLLGTGLFHFKVKLGNFESFDPVTGHFMLYASTDDINHVHLFIILLSTIIFCMTMVFLGFLVNRKRLSSMLPIQPMSHKRKLKLL